MDPCIICLIIDRQLSTHRLYEDDKTIAILDHHPSAPGHTLVALKKHGETILDYPPEELKELFATVQKVICALEKTLNCSGLSIGINHREIAGIHHLHVHLMPRFKGDGGEIVQNLVYNKTAESLESIAGKIKRNF